MGTLARGPMTASPSWPGGKPQEPPASGDSLAFTQLPMELLLSIFDAYVRLSEHPEKPGRAGIRGRGKALYALTTLNWTFNRLYEPALYRHVCLMGAASTALFARGLYCPRGKARQQHVRTLILLTSWSGINPIPGTVAANYSWDVVNLLENLGPSLSHLVLSPSLLGYCSSPMRIAYRLNNVTQVHLCGWEPGVVIRLRSAMQHSFEHAADEQDPVTEVVKGLISRQQDELAEHASHQATQRHRENPVPGGPRLPPPVVRRLQHGHLLALKRIELRNYTPASINALAGLEGLTHIVLSYFCSDYVPGIRNRWGGLADRSISLSPSSLNILVSSPHLERLVVEEEPETMCLVAGDVCNLWESSSEPPCQLARHEHWQKLVWRFEIKDKRQRELYIRWKRTKEIANRANVCRRQSGNAELDQKAINNARDARRSMEGWGDWARVVRQWVQSHPGRYWTPPQNGDINSQEPWALRPGDILGVGAGVFVAMEARGDEFREFVSEKSDMSSGDENEDL